MTGSKVLVVKLPELHADVKELEAFRAYVCDALGAGALVLPLGTTYAVEDFPALGAVEVGAGGRRACRDRRVKADACGRRRRTGRWRARRPLGARFGHGVGAGAGGGSLGNFEASAECAGQADADPEKPSGAEQRAALSCAADERGGNRGVLPAGGEASGADHGARGSQRLLEGAY